MNHAHSRPLFTIVAVRILVFAAVAMVAQFALVLWDYRGDPENLARLTLERETAALAQGLTVQGTKLGYALPDALADRYGRDGTGYIARIRTPGGVVLFSHCDQSCTEHFLPLDLNPPSFWLRSNSDSLPLSFAGGRAVEAGNHAVLIEIAIMGDPAGAVWGVLFDEVVEHMAVPMTLTVLFVLGATLLSIRSALAPIGAAAQQADTMNPLSGDARLETAEMPREVAQFAAAVNRSYDRVREVVRAQRLFTSAIAHEIRTPLSVVTLELERIDHPRARRALAEIADLSSFVDHAVALARLEAVDPGAFTPVDLDALAEDVVASLAGWIFQQGATIALDRGVGGIVHGHEVLLRDALRNLVDNAVRHGGVGVDTRKHARNGMLSPIEFERRHKAKAEGV